MKNIFIPLVLALVLILVGCQNFGYSDDSSSIISLPTNNTAETANGFRNPALAVSSKNQDASSTIGNSTTSPTLSEKFVASKNSKVFHKLDCSNAKRIKEENIIIFEDYEDASTNGYMPCSFCFKEK